MTKLTKAEALAKIEELKKYVADEEAKEAKPKTTIYKMNGDVLYESDKPTIKEALEEAVNQGANLREANLWEANLQEADLRGADLGGAELCNAKFYGKGGHQKLTKEQVPHFLAALGFEVEG